MLIENYQFFDPFYDKSYKEIKLPVSLIRIPDEAVLYYFSILREAVNLTEDKMGGCGTTGMAKLPFPIAYNFFTNEY